MATTRKLEVTTDKFASTAYVLYVITFFKDIKENRNNNKHNQFGGKVIDLLDWKSKQQASRL